MKIKIIKYECSNFLIDYILPPYFLCQSSLRVP